MAKQAVIFPGQGAQAVGMLAEAAAEFPGITDTFATASEVLGYDLWQLCQTGPQEELNLTQITQPLLLTSSVALWRELSARRELAPAFLAGHSLGEYSALVCAGVLEFSDAVALVRNRGRYMQEAVPVGEGAMAAVLGLDDEVVERCCQDMSRSDAVVEAVNFNSPGQVVIAGHEAAVAAAGEALREQGARRVASLPVSAPFHTSLMKVAGDRLAEDMAGMNFKAPAIPVVHNVNARTETDPEAIRNLMIEQTSSPVRWTAGVQVMVDAGVEQFVECGPGKVLSGLVKKIHRPATLWAIEKPEVLNEFIEA